MDCIGHSWAKVASSKRWKPTEDKSRGLASGTTADAECGFSMTTTKQDKQISRNIVGKVREIEDKLANGETAVVACNHGSNRSVLMVNLFYQKTYDIDYEAARQIMTAHRGVADGPLMPASLVASAEPEEFLRDVLCHPERVPNAITTRVNHHRRWKQGTINGLDWNAIANCADLDSEEPQVADVDAPPPDSAELTPDQLMCILDAPDKAPAPTEQPPRPVVEAGPSPPMVCQSECCRDKQQFMVPAAGPQPPAAHPPAPALAWSAPSARGRGRGRPKSGRGSRGRNAPRGTNDRCSASTRNKWALKGGNKVHAHVHAETPRPAETVGQATKAPAKAASAGHLTGILNLPKKALAAVVRSIRKITGMFPVPAAFRQYKAGKAKTRAQRLEAENVADFHIARHRGDHEVAHEAALAVAHAVRRKGEGARRDEKKTAQAGARAATEETGVQYKVCNHCLKLVPSTAYHDKRTCPELRRLLEADRLVHYKLQAGMSNRELQKLRFALGVDCAPVADFIRARDEKYAEVCKLTELFLDPQDNISVYAYYDDTLEWLITRPHIAPHLPPKTGTLVSIWTNDGELRELPFVCVALLE